MSQGSDGFSRFPRNPSSNKIALVVIDSTSKKAVLGLQAGNFTVKDNQNPVGVQKAQYSASGAQQGAAVTLVLDASGSMYDFAGSGSSKRRMEVAAEAAKLFVNRIDDQKDQVSIVAFDSDVMPLIQDNLNTYTFADANNQTITPNIPTSPGFTQDKNALNLLIDFYNQYSSLWHPSTPPSDIHITNGYYPFGGSTALWDATYNGTEIAVTQQGYRRYVIAMTDGKDNASSSETVDDVIKKCKLDGTPVYTIGIGDQHEVNQADLENLAKETGGSFTLVDPNSLENQLAPTFDGIRTAIKFEYQLQLDANLTSGNTIAVEVNYAGLSESGVFTAQ